MAVTSFQDLPVADRDREWDGAAAEKRVRQWAGAEDGPNEKYRDAHVWYDAENKDNFAATAPKAKLVHVAAHAMADTLDPLHSKVLLADEDGKPNYLEAKDVLGMDLKGTALIALSACESGLGRVEDGDEVLGFTRSFLSAGTSTLLASLWPVSDAATETLMTTLYDDLAKGEQVQDAMRDAQRAVLANPETAHPFFWAPFNLIGNWRLKVQK